MDDEQLMKYGATARREFIRSQEHRFRWTEKNGYSLRDIAWAVTEHFGLSKPPSPTTISNDLRVIEEQRAEPSDPTPEAIDALDPRRFAEWRRKYFVAPGGKPYETPPHQEAWFWLTAALALRAEMPPHVLDYYKDYGMDLDVNDWVERQDFLMTVWLLAPPRHGKTDLLRHVLIWLLCKDPNLRIIYVSVNADIAALTTAWMKREFEQNEQLIEDYGPFVTDGSWTDGEFTVATRTLNLTSPSIIALGRGSASVSRDADLIVMDDVVDIKTSESETQNDRILRTIKSNIFSRREPHTPVMGIGSHVPSPVGDIYEIMEAEEKENPTDYAKIRIVKFPAHDVKKCRDGDDDEAHGDWCLLWSSVRPYWYLEAQRHTFGDVMFEVVYNQEARKGGIIYFRDKVVRGDYPTPVLDEETNRYADLRPGQSAGILDRNRSWGVVPSCCNRGQGELLVAIGFDPAAGETRHAAESALSVRGGCRYCGRRYTIDLWQGRVSPETHPDTIGRYASQYRPHRVRVEINAYQKALARDPRLKAAAAQYGFVLDEWRTDERRNDPTMGVPLLSRHAEAGKWSVPYAHPQDQQKTEKLLRQLLRWPNKPNDMLFAEWLAELSVSQLIEEANYLTPSRWGDVDEIPEYLIEQSQTIDMSQVGRNIQW